MPGKDSGFKTITVSDKLYNSLNSKLKAGVESDGEKIDSMSKFIEHVFEQFMDSTNLIAIQKLAPQSGDLTFKWPSAAFDTLFDQMVAYKSTEWICSADHAKNIGKRQLSDALKTRIKNMETFKFEKTLIIADKLWTKPETWEWVWEVFSIIKENPKRHIVIRVIKEGKIKEKIEKDYYDMGLYSVDKVDNKGDTQQLVGFLLHNPSNSDPKYRWRLGENYYEEAEKEFIKLNAYAESNTSIKTMLADHVIAKCLESTG
ncbi:MAG: hypothetical protein FWE56_03010 [Candidatus Bathyarchaeota archaeon]|nr:hypothetical protein [Candidatus Termiticorpusculum sp.]MCL2868485.1 hypothetical protein [Candidatus Termiticorpusculum sp.]